MQKQPSYSNQVIKIEVDSILDKTDCAICMCKFNKPTVTKCGHTYCQDCIEEVVNQKHKCPLCNHDLTKNDLVTNFVLETLLKLIEQKKEEETKKYFENLADKVISQINNPE